MYHKSIWSTLRSSASYHIRPAVFENEIWPNLLRYKGIFLMCSTIRPPYRRLYALMARTILEKEGIFILLACETDCACLVWSVQGGRLENVVLGHQGG